MIYAHTVGGKLSCAALGIYVTPLVGIVALGSVLICNYLTRGQIKQIAIDRRLVETDPLLNNIVNYKVEKSKTKDDRDYQLVGPPDQLQATLEKLRTKPLEFTVIDKWGFWYWKQHVSLAELEKIETGSLEGHLICNVKHVDPVTGKTKGYFSIDFDQWENTGRTRFYIAMHSLIPWSTRQ